MPDRSEQILVDALAVNVAHVTASTLRHPEPPSALREPAASASVDPGLLGAGPIPSGLAARHRLVWASAAIVAAALVLGGVAVGRSGGQSRREEAGGRTHASISVPFAVSANTRYTVTGASASLDGGPSYLLLAGPTNTYTVTAYPPGDFDIATTGSVPMRVNGRPGYLGCLRETSPQSEPVCQGRQLAWLYAPDAWAEVTPATSKDTTAGLLDVARSIDFSRHAPVTFPLRIATAPAGAELMSWEFHYPPKTVTKDSSSITVTYRYPTGEFVQVFLFAGPATAHKQWHTPVSSAGRRGYWGADVRNLDLDVGQDLHVQIAESDAVETKTVLTLQDALAFAAGITASPHPEDRDTWFPIDSALATG